MNTVDELFANVPFEGGAFSLTGEEDTQENETSEESLPELNDEVDEPSHEGGNQIQNEKIEDDNTQVDNTVPFHEHPRFKELISQKNEIKERFEEQTKQLEELKSLIANQSSQPTKEETNVDPELIPLLGDDPKIHAQWKKVLQNERDQMLREFREQQSKEYQQQYEQQARWDNWVKESVSALKEQGKTFDENKLLKIAIDYKPTDDQGNIDFYKAYEIMKALEPAKDESKKIAKQKIASQTMKGSSSSNISEEKVIRSIDLKNKSWTDLFT